MKSVFTHSSCSLSYACASCISNVWSVVSDICSTKYSSCIRIYSTNSCTFFSCYFVASFYCASVLFNYWIVVSFLSNSLPISVLMSVMGSFIFGPSLLPWWLVQLLHRPSSQFPTIVLNCKSSTCAMSVN